MNNHTIYELKVFDDGECSVRKLNQAPVLPYNAILNGREELVQYLTGVIELRWPLEEVLERIDGAGVNEDVEFK